VKSQVQTCQNVSGFSEDTDTEVALNSPDGKAATVHLMIR